MEKKNCIITIGFIIVLLIFGIWFLTIIKTTPAEKALSEPAAEHKIESAAEHKPEPVAKHKPEPVAKVEPTVEAEPEPASVPVPALAIAPAIAPTPAVEVKPVDFDIVPLEDKDCAKCHPYAVKDINERGGLHQSIGCNECHLEHPPLGNDPIPTCEMCHDPGEATHYNIKNCNACHYPHYPTEMEFGEINVSACLSCHPAQGKEMEAKPSEHASLNCTECHTVHREWNNCADCHTPHAEEMTHADCLACHKPHSPKAVNYADGIPNNYCACCHENVGNALASSKKAHAEMSCIECHESEHMAVTQCDGCHDADLHGATMHERYPLCLDCHNNPHALAE